MQVPRLEQQRLFAEKYGWADADLFPLQADASSRTYTRLVKGAKTCLLMDAPPGKEKLKEFLEIQQHLVGLGLRPPQIYAADTSLGFALIEDFGDNTFTNLLTHGAPEKGLYLRAVDVLIQLHKKSDQAVAIDLPPYDMTLLLEEASRFLLWFVPADRGSEVTEEERKRYTQAWRTVLSDVAEDRGSLVFRDFHVDNLMILTDEGLDGCGLLDFQDALIGSAAYDMISLLEDARRAVSLDTQRAALKAYFTACPDINREIFESQLRVLGAQRHAKVVGLFVRLSVQEGKHAYLKYLPHVYGLFVQALKAPELRGVRDIVKTLLPDYENLDHIKLFLNKLRHD